MSTDTITKPVESDTDEAPAREFSHHDRCDRCGFQGYWVAILNATGSELVFCKHHGDKHTPALDTSKWTVLDFTHMLDKPLVSANVD